MVGRRKDQALVLRFYFDDYSLQLHRLSKSRICMNIQSVIVHLQTHRAFTYMLLYVLCNMNFTFELDGFPAVHNFSSMKSWFMLFLQANSSRKLRKVS